MPNVSVARANHGLAGKNIKISYEDRDLRLPAASNVTKKSSPLGITINTNVQAASAKPPQQIFPPLSSHSQLSATTHQTTEKKRKIAPKPLQLESQFSPSDREIPIALALPSPLTTAHQHGHKLHPHHINPTILITPTEEDFGQSSPLPTRHQLFKSRIASSVYSPRAISTDNRRHFKSGRSRASSTSTVFEEDSDASPSSASQMRQHITVPRPSLDSVPPTARRSIGWWNLITSPLPRRNRTGSSSTSEEETPLVHNVAVIAGEIGQNRAMPEESPLPGDDDENPFADWEIPTIGEAAKYYNPLNDFSTPRMNGRGKSSPDSSLLTATPRSDSTLMSPDGHEGSTIMPDKPAHIQGSSRKVPTPQVSSQTPPKSSCAAVMEHFEAQTPAIYRSNTARSTSPPQTMLSPSPVVEVATLQRLQKVRSAEADDSQTAAANNGREDASNAPPAFRVITNVMPSGQTSGVISAEEKDEAVPNPDLEHGTVVNDTAPKQIHNYFFAGATEPTVASDRQLGSPFETPAISQREKASAAVSQQKTTARQTTQPLPEKPAASKKASRRRSWWTKQRLLLAMIIIFFTGVVLLSIILCLTLLNHPPTVPVELQWMNLTGYPPLPTGISTIAGPNLINDESGCVATTSMWSCALPLEQQSVAPNSGPMPRFRLSILFNSESVTNSSAVQNATLRRSLQVEARKLPSMRITARNTLERRDTFEDITFHSSPSPPSNDEQVFIGNTTDQNATPFNGEATPFYISFLPNTVPSGPQISKRSVPNNSSQSTLLGKIPAPDLTTNGTASPALLYPLPSAQPLRLFNRGLLTEHYGFYSYFSRSIFLASATNSTNSSAMQNVTSAAQNTTGTSADSGGVLLSAANTVCTWSQTRFLVQIWTRSHASLLTSGGNGYSVGSSSTDAPSAFDFKVPGSFPWPVTITIDRHGGNAKDKGLYCYGMNEEGQVVSQQKMMPEEDRGIGGTIVNAAPAPFTEAAGGYGGSDGGSGGCKCQYINWQ